MLGFAHLNFAQLMVKLKKEAESSLRLSLGNARPIEKVKAEKVFELLKAHNSETM
jgi:hypothetical protein